MGLRERTRGKTVTTTVETYIDGVLVSVGETVEAYGKDGVLVATRESDITNKCRQIPGMCAIE